MTRAWRLVAVGLLLVIAGLLWFVLQTFPIGSGREVVVTVHPGDSMGQIASELHEAGVISSPLVFKADTVLFGAPLVRSGSYLLKQGSSYFSIKSIIGAYPNVDAIDVVPGLSLHEVALDLAADKGNSYAVAFYHDALYDAPEFLSKYGFKNLPASLEGLVGTGTYILMPKESPTQLLGAMVSSWQKSAKAQGLTPTTTVHLSPTKSLDWYQIMTTASIVQKEGYYTKNMDKVARVIWNRLVRGGDLQMDSTVLYSYGADGGTVTSAMLRTQTPYNTYLHPGLTPTPICAPSSTALYDALHPASGSWLYFVVIDKNGDEAFATTFQQQLANEKLAESRGV